MAQLFQRIFKKLSDLLDVIISSPSDGQILKYNGSTQKWVNAAAPSGSIPTLEQVTTAGASTDRAVTFNANTLFANDVSFSSVEIDIQDGSIINDGNLVVGSGAVAGSGAALTNLNASNISSGTIADAYLSSNVPLKNTNNIWAGDQTLNGHNIITDLVTGTKIGTTTTQKLGFFNATPVVQQTGNIITALSNLGLVTSGTVANTNFVGQAAHFTLIGPSSGAPATPTWRTLAASDLPDLSATYLPLTGGTLTGNLSLGSHSLVTNYGITIQNQNILVGASSFADGNFYCDNIQGANQDHFVTLQSDYGSLQVLDDGFYFNNLSILIGPTTISQFGNIDGLVDISFMAGANGTINNVNVISFDITNTAAFNSPYIEQDVNGGLYFNVTGYTTIIADIPFDTASVFTFHMWADDSEANDAEIIMSKGGMSGGIVGNPPLWSISGSTFIGDGSGLTGLISSHLSGALPAISGASLTSLNGTNISSGTVADARLSSNIPLKNGANVWTADQTLSTHNIVTDTTTGTKIGTATGQKLGLWNATPVAQQTTAVAAATFVASSGTAVNDASTFDGYTLKQVVKALRTIGILA